MAYFEGGLEQLAGMDYNVIYPDPAWTYNDICAAGKRGAAFKYDLMTLEAMKKLPVPDLCAKDCACFMWVTMPMLREGLELLGAWGFTFKTVAFTWVKTTKHGKLFWGMGRWSRSNAEIVMLGTRGKPSRQNAGVHSVIQAPVGPHSVKPEEARQRIELLMGDVPRLEMFARGDRNDGWDRWGNTPTMPVV